MKNFCIFEDAVNYIEENLCGELHRAEIAAACCCSLSTLEKVWRYCTHTSLKEYITKRRLVCCAEDIVNGGMTLTDIALKYGYNSPEVFTRAFRRLWGVSPSKFKAERHSTGFYPRIIPDESRFKGGVFMGKRVDITALYNELETRAEQDCYVLCFDVVGLDAINKNIGRGAGDLVIREAFRRIDEMAGETMLAFRIGGDEFAVVTDTAEQAAVEALAEKVIAQNARPIEWEGREIPVSLRIGAMKLRCGRHVRYHELFDRMQGVTERAKDSNKVTFFRQRQAVNRESERK